MKTMIELVLTLAVLFLIVSIFAPKTEREILEYSKSFIKDQQKLFKEVFGEKK